MAPVHENTDPTSVRVCNADEGEIIQLGPLKMRVLEDGLTVDNRISTVILTMPPRTRGPPQHWHEMHDETFYITKGNVTFEMGTEKVVVAAGGLAVVPPRANHTFSNDTDEEAELYCTCTPGYYVNYFRKLGELHSSGKKVEVPDVLNVMQRFATLPASM